MLVTSDICAGKASRRRNGNHSLLPERRNRIPAGEPIPTRIAIMHRFDALKRSRSKPPPELG